MCYRFHQRRHAAILARGPPRLQCPRKGRLGMPYLPRLGATRASCLGLSQYGLLHLGHTRGGWFSRGTHSWPHRSHLYPQTSILTFFILPKPTPLGIPRQGY
jgi:hypothetical protein